MTLRIVCVLLAVGLSGVSAAPPITAAVFAPDGRSVVLGSQAGVEIRSWPALKAVGRLDAGLSHVHDLAFSPDGKVLLAAGGTPAEKGVVAVLSWPDGKVLRRVADSRDLVYRVAWSPDGTRWVAGGADGICRVYAAEGGEPVLYGGHSRPVLAVAFLPDGKTVLSAGVDQTLQAWNATTGKAARTLDNHTQAVNDLAVRPGIPGSAPPVVASAGDDRTVRLWQPTIGRLMRFARLDAAPRAVAWSPDGQRLLVGDNDGKLHVFDPDTLAPLAERIALPGRIHALAVAPGGATVLVAGQDGKVAVAESTATRTGP